MLHPVPTLKETPSQTAGPYVHIGLTPNFADIRGVYATDPGSTMLTPDTKGDRITITGRIIDGSGAVVNDALLELWQADADGSYTAPMGPNSNSAPAFTGWGRQPTNADGVFTFETIKPGPVPGPDGKPMAPHVNLWIVARNKIMDPRRRQTLIARKEDGPVPRYVLDIHLQGDKETVFFDM